MPISNSSSLCCIPSLVLKGLFHSSCSHVLPSSPHFLSAILFSFSLSHTHTIAQWESCSLSLHRTSLTRDGLPLLTGYHSALFKVIVGKICANKNRAEACKSPSSAKGLFVSSVHYMTVPSGKYKKSVCNRCCHAGTLFGTLAVSYSTKSAPKCESVT